MAWRASTPSGQRFRGVPVFSLLLLLVPVRLGLGTSGVHHGALHCGMSTPPQADYLH